jgi:hypothetical protein
MDRTFKVVLFAGLLSGCIALLNGLLGWPVISRELSSLTTAFCIVALLPPAPFLLFGAAELRLKNTGD